MLRKEVRKFGARGTYRLFCFYVLHPAEIGVTAEIGVRSFHATLGLVNFTNGQTPETRICRCDLSRDFTGDRREAIYDDDENRAYLRPSKPIDIAYGITYAIHFKELLCPL